jgi:GTP 3',8-cyclase
VLQRGVNDDQVEGLAGWARDLGVTLRFIEFMDVGTTNRWQRDRVVPRRRGRRAHRRALADRAGRPRRIPGEVAERYRYVDGAGEVGIIASVTRPFCGTCSRARLSAVGELYTCLFAAEGHDLRALVRGDADDERCTCRGRRHLVAPRRPCLGAAREDGLQGPRVEMSYIGG